MKVRIIRILIILIAILPSWTSFRYLDDECASFGRSILGREHTLNSMGVGVSLYTRCPSSIEFTDKKNNDICCYFSWLPNKKCIPQPPERNQLLFYIISETHLFLCEMDSSGEKHYKKIFRGRNSKIQVEDVDRINIDRQNPKIVSFNLIDCGGKIDARDCCLHIVILLTLLLVIEIICGTYVLVKNMHKEQHGLT